MTDNTTPAEIDTETEVASQEQKLSYEELEAKLNEANDSIAKLEENRDNILKEKRAKSDANNEAQAELDTVASNFRQHVEDQMVNTFIDVANGHDAEKLFKQVLKDHISIDIKENKFAYIDKDGNELSVKELRDLMVEEYGMFMKAPKSSGAEARGGAAGQTHSSSRVKSKANPQLFGIGK